MVGRQAAADAAKEEDVATVLTESGAEQGDKDEEEDGQEEEVHWHTVGGCC